MTGSAGHTEDMTTPPADPQPDPAGSDAARAAAERARALREVGAGHARRVLSAYSGEHGIYGIVLVTALIAAEIDADSDLDVILFLLGTVGVFWLAHIYAAVVASRARRPAPPLRAGIRDGVRHSAGMALAMLVPVAFLALGTATVLDEWTGYWLALSSGVVMLGLIGYANARRNGSPWPWRILGVVVTTGFGIVVITLSILVH